VNRAPVSAQRGFTLIELLVAVAILAVVAVLGWRGLDAVARSRDDASRAFTTSSRLADGMQQFGDDLRHAVSQGPGLPAVSVLGGGLFIVRRPAQPWAAMCAPMSVRASACRRMRASCRWCAGRCRTARSSAVSARPPIAAPSCSRPCKTPPRLC
jgi:prepilin-type N-terminal cleavage/methylation domain